jgi:hypothetical protein
VTTAPPTADAAAERARPPAPDPSALRKVFRLWTPLMVSWALMGVELPMISAALARMPDSDLQLASLSGIVFPLSLLIEAPIIMLLSASTALCADRKTEAWLRSFTTWSLVVLTAVHAAVALTPLYGLVVDDLLGIDESLHAAGRLGLLLALPWPGAIAWRRFRQGILIREERSAAVGQGTLVRLIADVSVLGTGLLLARWAPDYAIPGAALGGLTLGTGVLAEAIYAEWCAAPVVRERLSTDDPSVEALTWRGFWAFYAPLALTPFLTLGIQPFTSATMSRMPDPLTSLAAWSPVYGLMFLLRSPGFAFQEVVVALARRPAGAALDRAALIVAAFVTSLVLFLSLGPVGAFWFGQLAGLRPELVDLARTGMLTAALMPALSVFLHLNQGRLVAAGRTRHVTAGVVVYSIVAAILLGAGAFFDPTVGLPWCLGTLFTAACCQTTWLVLAVRRVAPATRARP